MGRWYFEGEMELPENAFSSAAVHSWLKSLVAAVIKQLR